MVADMSSVDMDGVDMANAADPDSAVAPDFTIDVIGFGLSVDDLTEKHKRIIDGADLLVGGRRHLDCFRDISCEKIAITKDIEGVVEKIRNSAEHGRHVVVVASGDPLFHGIGTTLINALGKERVNIYPNISSVAAAFAAIREPWDDLQLVSLHGMDADREVVKLNDRDLLDKSRTIAILTDHLKTPAWIAQHLILRKVSGFRIYVFEKMGSADQRISYYDDMEVAAREIFSSPNVVILKKMEREGCIKREEPRQVSGREDALPMQISPGMADDLFFHQKGLITKSEIRAVVLSKLQLISDDHVFWDLGAGSGSVSIEVSRFIPRGRIFAVEKSGTRVIDIRKNMEKFGISRSDLSRVNSAGAVQSATSNMEVVHGELPDAMEQLPDPDRIFIGGGGADISEIICRAGERLAMDGIMVINTVLIQTMNLAMSSLKRMGFHVKLIQVQVSAAKEMPFGERLDPLNPVWIISGKKPWSSKAGLKI